MSLPRGWTYMNNGLFNNYNISAQSSSGAGACRLPGIPGVSHVLTAMNGNISGTRSSPDIICQLCAADLLAGTFFYFDTQYAAFTTDGLTTGFDFSWTGELPMSVGAAIVVFISAVAGGSSSNVYSAGTDCAGYDL